MLDTWQVSSSEPVNLYPGQPPLFSANNPSLKHRLTQTARAKILSNRVTSIPKGEMYTINVRADDTQSNLPSDEK